MAKTCWMVVGVVLVSGFVIAKMVAGATKEDGSVENENPYLNDPMINRDRLKNQSNIQKRSFSSEEKIAETVYHIPSVYENYMKPVIDQILAFCGLVFLSPLCLVIAIAIFFDDPGTVFFTQKRVGKNKHFFMLHKFRSMKMSAPHDIPTHDFSDPNKYITRVGQFLRKTSLDELPQLWDIFRGKMSIIGPRPALWNQADLIEERDKYGANDVMPGLTGLAQINGRDELEITDKAKMDGNYASNVNFFMDVKCFFGTIIKVLEADGVVEGGTGGVHKRGEIQTGDACQTRRIHFALRPSVPEEGVGTEFGFKKTFCVDTTRHVRVLITGENSYIGISFERYVTEHYEKQISIDSLNLRDDAWREYDFSQYDTVFHVAGIAHADIEKVSEAEKEQYYRVNTDLAIETAKKCKESGVRQFIFMSSMIIYGGKEYINEGTQPCPVNVYGDSKWQADKGIRNLGSADFAVAVLRPPMIYGAGSKGNYQVLNKLAKRFLIFPKVSNMRSMLYIENLCEFTSRLILTGEGGIYFPQNAEYSSTSSLVNLIALAANRRIYVTKILAPVVFIVAHIPAKVGRMAEKAFGSSYYDQKLSIYNGLDYQKFTLAESVERIESQWGCISGNKKRVLILVNHDVVIYNFRLELVERLLNDGYEVHVSSPYGERIDTLVSLGVKYHEISIERHGMQPVAELGILNEYYKLIKKIRPIVVFSYTIKPNIYGAIASRAAGVPFVANITGLGTAVENAGIQQVLTTNMYRYAFGGRNSKIQRVFFQNKENEEFFTKCGIALDCHRLLPGSGVNLKRYPFIEYPGCGNGVVGSPVKFAFISRIMKEKGIEEYLKAAEMVKTDYPNTEFHVAGFSESEYKGRLEELNMNGTVIYHGMIRDVAGLMAQMHCIIHPTYYPEGLSNVLLEASSCGRPIITTDRPGCREVCKNGRNGFLVEEKNYKELVKIIIHFISLNWKQKKEMGNVGRELVERFFDRQIVVEAYMEELHKAENVYT